MNIFTIILLIIGLVSLAVSITLVVVSACEKKPKISKNFTAHGYVGETISSISLCGLVNKGNEQTKAKQLEERNKLKAFYKSNIYNYIRG